MLYKASQDGLGMRHTVAYVASKRPTATVDATVAFSFGIPEKALRNIWNEFEAIRLVEEPTRFVGTLAQVQIVSGFKVSNPTCVLLKYHDASAT